MNICMQKNAKILGLLRNLFFIKFMQKNVKILGALKLGFCSLKKSVFLKKPFNSFGIIQCSYLERVRTWSTPSFVEHKFETLVLGHLGLLTNFAATLLKLKN